MFWKAAAVLTALLLSGCSSQTSDLRLARSLAAESETFVGFVSGGQATRHYAEEQTGYLEDAIQQLLEEEDVAGDARANLVMLMGELSRVRGLIAGGNKSALAGVQSRIGKIRENLEKASPQS